MKVVTSELMKKIDRYAIDEVGIPGVVLMENAARAVFNEMVRFRDVRKRRIAVFCGKGNNGGDALALSRYLYEEGIDVKVFILGLESMFSGEAKINLNIAKNMGINVVELYQRDQLKFLERNIKEYDVIIDGIFGTGLKGDVSGIVAEVIDIINKSGAYIYAIDIPSGINADTGEVMGIAVKANKTVTFQFPKIGQLLYPGRDYVGDLVVREIGIPKKVLEVFDIKTEIITGDLVSKFIKPRHPNTHKGDYGKVLIIAGSSGMLGAAVLCSMAALKAGSGLAYLAVPESLIKIIETKLTEVIKKPLKDWNKGSLSKEALPQILELAEDMDVLAMGPGLSADENITEIVAEVVRYSKVPLVIDADGINALSKDLEILKEARVPIVLTPHPGEMSRLLKMDTRQILKDPIQYAKSFSKEYNVIVVLKGSRTVIALPDGRIYININGNPGMATAGSGDVLTGIIASLIGQGLKPEEAAISGVYVHGFSGDLAKIEKGEYGIIASDILNMVPYAIKRLLR